MSETFPYEALRRDGRAVTGRVAAASRAQALDLIRAQALLPTAIGAPEAAAKDSFWHRDIALSRRIAPLARAAMARELGLLLDAGIPLDRCLDLLAKSASSARLSGLLERLRERILAGGSLSQALSREDNGFGRDEIAMILAGEQSGGSAAVLASLAAALERRAELAARLSSALIYPAILMALALATVVLIVTVVLPNLMPLFENARSQPPLAIRFMLALPAVLAEGWPLIAAAMFAAGAATVLAWRNPSARQAIDRRLLALPFAGRLLAQADTARFCRTLATLLDSGVPMIQALNVAREVCRNRVIRQGLAEAAGRVAAGQRLAAALEPVNALPAPVRQLIAVGEEANRLDDLLRHAALTLETVVHRDLERAMTLLTPALTIAIGALIGGLIVSVMQTILGVNDLAFQ